MPGGPTVTQETVTLRALKMGLRGWSSQHWALGQRGREGRALDTDAHACPLLGNGTWRVSAGAGTCAMASDLRVELVSSPGLARNTPVMCQIPTKLNPELLSDCSDSLSDPAERQETRRPDSRSEGGEPVPHEPQNLPRAPRNPAAGGQAPSAASTCRGLCFLLSSVRLVCR